LTPLENNIGPELSSRLDLSNDREAAHCAPVAGRLVDKDGAQNGRVTKK
jgi:hypothetical protein